MLRAEDHRSGATIAKAGATASFVAVKRDFVEPREVPGLALLPDAVTMLASRGAPAAPCGLAHRSG
ncbi:MAG: hypothetical protein ACRDSR_20540 [Pseudonocardiaceae bacterium]